MMSQFNYPKIPVGTILAYENNMVVITGSIYNNYSEYMCNYCDHNDFYTLNTYKIVPDKMPTIIYCILRCRHCMDFMKQI